MLPCDLLADALPQFMANGDKLQYHSTNILGRMHDAIMAVADGRRNRLRPRICIRFAPGC